MCGRKGEKDVRAENNKKGGRYEEGDVEKGERFYNRISLVK